MNKRLLPLLAAVACLCAARPAGAWGVEGHEVVATIAYDLLSVQARSAADALLADDPVPANCGSGSFAFASIWPDRLREDPRQCASPNKWGDTASWHVVAIPLSANTYDAARDCPGGNCVTARIAYFAKILGDKKADPSKRRDALKFVIHLVGDLHQPLHTAAAPRNPLPDGALRAFWEEDAVAAISPDADTAAEMLMKNSPQAPGIAAGSLADWTNQSHRLAVKIAGGQLPPGAPSEPAAAAQLQAAGIRLAAILDPLLK